MVVKKRQKYLWMAFLTAFVIVTVLEISACSRNVNIEKPERTAPETKKNNFPNKISADFSTDLVFTKDKLFFIEKDGKLKELKIGQSSSRTLKTVKVPRIGGYNETGLLGMALSPNFSQDKQIYLYHTYIKGNRMLNRVVRLQADEPDKQPVVIVDNILAEAIHNGGKLAFGPDSKLYIATGEANRPKLAQDIKSLNGKVLRVNPDGTVPSDNPFGNAVWSYGHRNIYGMAFDDEDRLFVTENGPTGDDEVNEILKGQNYGWPIETGKGSGHFGRPLVTFEEAIAPTGLIFYTGDKYGGLKDKLIFGDYIGGNVHRLELTDGSAKDRVIATLSGRVTALAQTDDGYIYAATTGGIERIE